MRILVAALFTAVMATQAIASPLPDYPFVFAEGRAETELPPELADISFRVRVFDESSSNGLERVQHDAAKTIAVLIEHGVGKKDIVAYEVEKNLVREGQNDGFDSGFFASTESLTVVGYDMGRRVSFTLRDLQQYEGLVTELLAMPSTVGLQVSFERTDKKQIEERLLVEAVEEAKQKAERMAVAAGQRLGDLKAISQRGFFGFGNEFGVGSSDAAMYRTRSEPEPDVFFVPSTIDYSSSVKVIYELESE